MNRMYDAARRYAKLGWRVFPILAITPSGGCECEDGLECDKAGKHPAIKGWNKEATVDLTQIEEWWGKRPDRGIGLATGEDSNLTVLDVDGEEGVAELGALSVGSGVPPTPCVSSRPGRYHYYFQYTADVKSKSKNLGKHLDTRSENGYVVAPPSRHIAGTEYKWIQAPEKVELAEWPTFLAEKAKEGKKRGRPAKETFNPANPADETRLKSALEHIDPDDEERWAQVGWVLGRAYRQSDHGYTVYQAWAARSRKYDAKRTRGHYYERSREIRGADLRTTGTIYRWAQEAGWQPENAEELAARDFHIFENPFNEATTVAEFAEAAIAAPNIFQQGMRLVHIVLYGASGTEDEGISRDPTSYIVLDHDTDTLAVEFGRIAAYWHRTAAGHRRGKFDRGAIRTYLHCRDFRGAKQLLAFVSHPTLRGDGTLIDQVGYDPTSKLYLTQTVPGLKIDSRLSAKQARRSMEALLEPFSEYPWSWAVDRAVFCASLFTVGLRHLFDIAPLFAFSSPKHGSGKTQLAECINRLWYGTTLSKATWTPNPEEMEKRIAAFLLAGDRMVCLDNVTEGTRLEDSTLNKVLTSRRNTFRLLGKTERIELINEATWFATGNQLNVSGDIARRALVCYIDPQMVDPGARSFTIENLPSHILQHRSQLMSLALSIVSSWIHAGRPVPKVAPREYGSFTSWYAFLRPLLLWCGMEDIAVAIDHVTEEDYEHGALEQFMNALRKAMPPDGTAASMKMLMGYVQKDSDLGAAFTGCLPAEGRVGVNYRNLGDLMRRCQNKIFLTDNPGVKFTIVKRKDSLGGGKNWVWIIKYVEERVSDRK